MTDLTNCSKTAWSGPTTSRWIKYFVGWGPLTLAGCGGDFQSDESEAFLVGAKDGYVFYEYHERFTGFETLPSSLWRLDLETLQAKRIREPTRQFNLQVEGDYYATELVRDNETTGRIVSVEIDSGRSTTLYERQLYPAKSERGIHLLSGVRVVVLADDDLLVFNAGEEDPAKTIALTDGTFELSAFSGEQVLVLRGEENASVTPVLINLATAEQFEIPPAPGDQQPFYDGARLTPTSIAVSRLEEIDEETARFDVLLFDIAEETWSVLAEYDAFDPTQFSPPALFVRGHDDEYVVVEYIKFQLGTLSSMWSIETIDVDTGEREAIAQKNAGFLLSSTFPRLNDGRVYWIDPLWQLAVVCEIDSGEQKAVPLHIPD